MQYYYIPKILLLCFVCCWIILTIIIQAYTNLKHSFICTEAIWECNNHHHSKRTKTFSFHSLILFDWCYKVSVTLIGNLVAMDANAVFVICDIWSKVRTTFTFKFKVINDVTATQIMIWPQLRLSQFVKWIYIAVYRLIFNIPI